MKGVYFSGGREIEIADVPDPTPGPGEVVIAIKASGMCGTDLRFYRAPKGSRPRVIGGHEPCGLVADVGPGVGKREARVGQRVMDHHYAGCGVCVHCRQGWTQLCDDGATVFGNSGDGAHCEYMKVPAYTLVPLPEELSFVAGAAVSCGTGTAYGGLRRLEVSGRDTLAVFGQGPVGLAATQLAVAMGARVLAVDPVAERRERATVFGAEAAIDPGADDAVEMLRAATRGRGVDCALDCTSSAEARAQAVRACRTWGRACFVGMGGDVRFDVDAEIVRKQMTVMGSWTFSITGQADCARFVAERGVDVDALFTHHWSLEQADEAYRVFDAQTAGKGVFVL